MLHIACQAGAAGTGCRDCSKVERLRQERLRRTTSQVIESRSHEKYAINEYDETG